MRALLKTVARLQRLAAFESAARLGSFTAAAVELDVTQPAVTRQVRALEATLGVQLFARSANRAMLSEPGRRLYEAVDGSFAALEAALDRITADTATFVLAANPGVAQRWLVPHLDGLREALGELDLRLWLFDRNADLDGGAFDAAVHIGAGDWPGFECRLLFPERVVPVATPALAAERGLGQNTPPRKLLTEALLHLDDTDRPWMSWHSWFAQHGIAFPARSEPVIYNNYALILQEAMAGHGIALAWRYLVDDLLAQGLLVDVGPEVNHASSGYYLIWPKASRMQTVVRLAEWLDELIHGDAARDG